MSKKSTGTDSRRVQDQRRAAFNELCQSIQSYTDSFVLSMQCQEREERLRKQQRIDEAREDDRIINELALILQSGTINDYDYGPEQVRYSK